MKQITAAEFESEVLAAPLPVLVDFYTEQCPPCRSLHPILAEIESEKSNKLKIVKVNAADEPELAARFRVGSVPALLLFRDGQCIAQRLGSRGKKDLLAWLDQS
jgi:thioredoxin 1